MYSSGDYFAVRYEKTTDICRAYTHTHSHSFKREIKKYKRSYMYEFLTFLFLLWFIFPLHLTLDPTLPKHALL